MIDSTVKLSIAHRIFFTEDAFTSGSEVLEAALFSDESPRLRRALIIVEARVASAQPALLPAIQEWCLAQTATRLSAGSILTFPGGEACKNDFGLVRELWDAIHEAHIDRHSYIIAIGGGALLDLVGFAAATAHRGVRLVRMPTTTLSQADGGVGVKNGINAYQKKNWIGTFAVPWAVVNDFNLLLSQPEEVMREGLIEAIKVALIRDADFYHDLRAHRDELRSLDRAYLCTVIRRSAELHAEHICTGGDAFELGSARPLDFGHWAAHRLEPATGYRLSHGRAVAIGMALDLIYAQRMELLSEEALSEILELITAAGFALYDPALSERDDAGALTLIQGLEDFREHLGGALTITLVTSPGTAIEVHTMDTSVIAAAADELAARHAINDR